MRAGDDRRTINSKRPKAKLIHKCTQAPTSGLSTPLVLSIPTHLSFLMKLTCFLIAFTTIYWKKKKIRQVSSPSHCSNSWFIIPKSKLVSWYCIYVTTSFGYNIFWLQHLLVTTSFGRWFDQFSWITIMEWTWTNPRNKLCLILNQ